MGQITQQERTAIGSAARAIANPFDSTVEELENFDPLTGGADDDEARDDEEEGDEEDVEGILGKAAEGVEVTFSAEQGDEPTYTATGRLEFARKFTNAQATQKNVGGRNPEWNHPRDDKPQDHSWLAAAPSGRKKSWGGTP